jgi:hypothetical protein
MAGYVPVADDAISVCQTGAELGLVLDLYSRARRLRWEPFDVTERGLCTKHGMGNTRLRNLLRALEDVGVLRVIRPKARHLRTKLHIPSPVKQHATQHAKQGKQGSLRDTSEGKATGKATGKAQYLESREESLEPSLNPSRREGLISQLVEWMEEPMRVSLRQGVEPTVDGVLHLMKTQDKVITTKRAWIEQAIQISRAQVEEP